MSPEEYQRIKEAEKAHLRKLRELKKAVYLLERQQSINRTLNNMSSASQDLLDTHAELVERLAMETAESEARLEVALDATQAEGEAAGPSVEEMESELQKARALELVRQMKSEVGAGAAEQVRRRPRTENAKAGEASATPEDTAARQPSRAEEDRAPFSDPEGFPEKTIGRMRPS